MHLLTLNNNFFRHFGLATHFVPADRLDYLEDCLISLDRPSVENIRAAIDRLSIKLDDVNTGKLMPDKNKNIIDRYVSKNIKCKFRKLIYSKLAAFDSTQLQKYLRRCRTKDLNFH